MLFSILKDRAYFQMVKMLNIFNFMIADYEFDVRVTVQLSLDQSITRSLIKNEDFNLR